MYVMGLSGVFRLFYVTLHVLTNDYSAIILTLRRRQQN